MYLADCPIAVLTKQPAHIACFVVVVDTCKALLTKLLFADYAQPVLIIPKGLPIIDGHPVSFKVPIRRHSPYLASVDHQVLDEFP